MASTTCLRYNENWTEPMYMNVQYVYQMHACEYNESAWEPLMNHIFVGTRMLLASVFG